MGLKAINPGDILQAIETQLVAYNKGAILPTADLIFWRRRGYEPPEKIGGKRDIVLVAMNKLVGKGAQIGGGRLGLRYELLIEVHLRTINKLDQVGNEKNWLKEAWGIEDQIVDALEAFGPNDGAGNDYTIEGLRIDTSLTPEADRLTPKWGQTVGTWRCHYLPKLPNLAHITLG